eukprot:m.403870 g.403870  ORF g.403870 m.403870 type:complete len:402 (-) comp21195_c0_seq5:217-1422(-)
MASVPPGWMYVQCPRIACARSLAVPTCAAGRIQCGSCQNIFMIHKEDDLQKPWQYSSGVAPFPPVETQISCGSEQTVAALRKRYGSWDDAALQDVLRSCNGNAFSATKILDEWTQGHRPSRNSLASFTAHSDNAEPQDIATKKHQDILPSVFIARPEYDRIVSELLGRKCPSPASLVMMMLAAKKLRQNAERAHEHHSKHQHKKGMLGTLVAYRPWHRKHHHKKETHSHDTLHAAPKVSTKSTDPPAQPVTREDSILGGIKRLEERLKHLGMRTIPSEDDGNCQFRSLSQELYGTQDYHLGVRASVVQHMMMHADSFAPFVGTDEDFQRYLRDMSKNKTWGDELTLRAAVDFFNVKVHVITTEATNYLLHYDPETDSHNVKRHVFLSYVSPIHYNTVAPLP